MIFNEDSRVKIPALLHFTRLGYPAVNPDVVAGYEIPFPPEALVDRFHATVKDSFDLIQMNQKQNQELTELRDWLIPMLMNGQVTVADQTR